MKKFLKNLRYLFKYDFLNKTNEEYEYIIEQVLYEIPSSNVYRPLIKNMEQTVDSLIHSNLSIARFGDGELSIMDGKFIPFQEYNEALARRLKEILTGDNPNLMIGINREYYYPEIDKLLPNVGSFYRRAVPKLRRQLSKYINSDKEYCTANFSQAYMFLKEYDFDNYYKNLRRIWDNKDILIVTCKEVLKNIKYNIYDNARKIDYLYILPRNAYSKYDEIYNAILKYAKNTLIILMVGPTANVLADDLSKKQYRALDLGHLLKDYDYYKNFIERDMDNLVKFIMPD